ncbi:elongation factor G [Virgisporangium ochraceum]|uniref:Tetracycline resistance protein, tetM/tetO subfamily n=1 Tax=Virgisporangium ochraceum TaxID=65505 RepID=A0A8J3ZX74_9ACTN|nr:TetM/TetW/TetO/TetS family tetracycline resistance ribosomal protection protein [Virgisporangium ochraceum]GIJ69818.1 tetracycline resistance protein, tetM/tetO subfamily [Virgisporangium ochraceum]
MHFLNLGILAHVDAGKTSLTERLLHAAGVIDEVGSVDAGNTRTDSMELERQRGITIKAAVVSFPLTDDVTVNLIDTPGHPDFIAEVERALAVLDGAVLVVSAVEGVQAQTRVLMRALARLRLPMLIFINKTDRRNADPGRVLAELAGLVPAVDAGADLLPHLAEYDDDLLAAYVDGEHPGDLTRRFRQQTAAARVHPVFSGSAITGTGVPQLMDGIATLLPTAAADPDAPLSGTVFKIDRGPAGERIAYVRMFGGTLRVRDRLGDLGRITGIEVFENGAAVARPAVVAGRIATLRGLSRVRIGDALGRPAVDRSFAFVPPSLETVVEPAGRRDAGALHAALTQLAEQDPLINLRQGRDGLAVSLYGEVQKEIIEATLRREHGIDVTFRESTTIHVERPVGSGSAEEVIATGDNPFLATVGLRIDPAPPGSGQAFRLEVELGSMPYAFFVAVEETVHRTLAEGLHGWQVVDCTVTMNRSGYWARQSHSHGTFDKSMSSTAGDFRNLTPLVLMDALRAAGTRVYEPVHAFHLDCPADLLPALLPTLARLRAVPLGATGGEITGEIPAASVHDLQLVLPSLTRGEGTLETTFDHYQPVADPPPDRPRTDHNPLNRKEYLLAVVRRVP